MKKYIMIGERPNYKNLKVDSKLGFFEALLLSGPKHNDSKPLESMAEPIHIHDYHSSSFYNQTSLLIVNRGQNYSEEQALHIFSSYAYEESSKVSVLIVPSGGKSRNRRKIKYRIMKKSIKL